MKAKEIEPIVEYLIEEYFENNGGIHDYKDKSASFYCFNKPERVKVSFEWISGVTEFGTESNCSEHFYFGEYEKITNLQNYVWEAIERILKVPYYDERPRQDDPTLQ